MKELMLAAATRRGYRYIQHRPCQRDILALDFEVHEAARFGGTTRYLTVYLPHAIIERLTNADQAAATIAQSFHDAYTFKRRVLDQRDSEQYPLSS